MENNTAELTQARWIHDIYADKSIMRHCKRSFQFSWPRQPPRHHLHLSSRHMVKHPHPFPSVVLRNRHWGPSYVIAHEASDRAWHQAVAWEFVVSGTARHSEEPPYKPSKALPISCRLMYLSYIYPQSITWHVGHSSLLRSQTCGDIRDEEHEQSALCICNSRTKNVSIFTLRSYSRNNQKLILIINSLSIHNFPTCFLSRGCFTYQMFKLLQAFH